MVAAKEIKTTLEKWEIARKHVEEKMVCADALKA